MNITRKVFIKFISILFFSTLSFFTLAQGQEELAVNTAIENGNAKVLSKYLGNTIELSIPGSEGNYSDRQATILLTKFFKANPPTSFSVKHRGTSSDDTIYCICEYVTKTNSYRTYYLCNAQNGKIKLLQLKFDTK